MAAIVKSIKYLRKYQILILYKLSLKLEEEENIPTCYTRPALPTESTHRHRKIKLKTSISLIIGVTIHNEILANRSEQYIKSGINHDKIQVDKM